jgi:hypothetical protein
MGMCICVTLSGQFIFPFRFGLSTAWAHGKFHKKQQSMHSLQLFCKVLLNILKYFLRERDSLKFPEQNLEYNKLPYIQIGKFQKLNCVISRRVEIWIKSHMCLVLICFSGKIFRSVFDVPCGLYAYMCEFIHKGKLIFNVCILLY